MAYFEPDGAGAGRSPFVERLLLTARPPKSNPGHGKPLGLLMAGTVFGLSVCSWRVGVAARCCRRGRGVHGGMARGGLIRG